MKMKHKIVRVLSLTALFLCISPLIDTTIKAAKTDIIYSNVEHNSSSIVYYCTGPKAEKYHRSSRCRGLRKCSCPIVKCTESEARAKGFKPCKICY